MIQYGARAARPRRMPWSSGMLAKPGMKYRTHTPRTRKTAPSPNDSVRTRAGETRAWVARNGGEEKAKTKELGSGTGVGRGMGRGPAVRNRPPPAEGVMKAGRRRGPAGGLPGHARG